MKRVKILLSVILIMAVVAGALAFKVRSVDKCLYSTTDATNPQATSICTLVQQQCAPLVTVGGSANTNYAATSQCHLPTFECAATLECSQFRTLGAEGGVD